MLSKLVSCLFLNSCEYFFEESVNIRSGNSSFYIQE